jgi:phage minor structural protein
MAIMIYLFDRHLTMQGVLTNESPDATPYYNDEHLEQLDDGVSTYSFDTPSNSRMSEHVIAENYIAFRDLDGYLTLFQIKEVTKKQENGQYLLNVISENTAVGDLLGEIIRPQTFTGSSAEQLTGLLLQNTQWEVGNVEWLGVRTISFDNYPTVLAALRETAVAFEGELRFRVTMYGNEITGRYVDLLERRGDITGKRFEYEKDIIGLRRSEDSTDLVTALIGIGKADNNGNRLTFKSAVWEKDRHGVDKPAGQDWIGDDEALARWGKDGKHIVGVYESDADNSYSLMEETWKELKTRNKPRLTYEVDVVLLERIAGLSHERVRMGDTIQVIDLTFNPALILDARVIELRRSYTDPTQDAAVLGEFAPTIIDSMSIASQLNDLLARKSGPWDASVIYKSRVKPSITEPDALWLDTSKTPNVLMRYEESVADFVKAGVEAPSDIGAPTTNEAIEIADSKAQHYADIAEGNAITAAETNAKLQADAAEQAAKAHADAAAEAKRIEAEAYADGIVSDEESARIADANAKLAAAKEYAETKANDAKAAAVAEAKLDAASKANAAKSAAISQAVLEAAAAEANAKAHADGIVSTEEQARLDGIAQALSDAKADATAKADAAETAALNAAKLDAAAKANAAESAAKAHAEAQAAAAQTAAEVYADGQVSAEEAARLQQATDNLNAAKSHADSTAAAAETAAKEFATLEAQEKADAALTAAKADAKSKADAAQAAAESVARSEAALAEANAKAYADGIITPEEAENLANLEQELADARAYADQQATAAKNAAISTASADATSKSNAAKSAAISAANAETALAETRAKAYADGVVSDEEAARIQQAADNLAAAKADAQNKANAAKAAAIDAAALDAQSKANAAKAAAISAAKAETALAETRAKAHADGIVSEEEQARINQAAANLAAAKTDATNKAAAAESAAKSHADLVAEEKAKAAEWYASVISGPNLVKDFGSGSAPSGYEWFVAETPDGTKGRVLRKKHEAGASSNNAGFYLSKIKVDPKKTYLMEMSIKAFDQNSRYYYGREETKEDGSANDQGNGPYLVGGKTASSSDVGKWVKHYALVTPHDTGSEQSHSTDQSPYTPDTEYKFWSAETAYIQPKIFMTYSVSNLSQVSEMHVSKVGIYEVGSADAFYGEIGLAEANAKAHADSKAAAAEAAAKSYAVAQAQAERVKAEAYADGQISAEEQARINDVNAKLATAKSYAESTASAAETAAKSHADTAAGTAESNAKSYANTKAGQAESNAKSHADTVADQAEANAKNAVANGQVNIPLSKAVGDFQISSGRKITADSNFYWDQWGLLLRNPSNPDHIVRLSSTGIAISKNGGYNYDTAITSDGVIGDRIVGQKITGILLEGVNINTEQDIRIGRDLYLGDWDSSSQKNIYFNENSGNSINGGHGPFYSDIQLNGYEVELNGSGNGVVLGTRYNYDTYLYEESGSFRDGQFELPYNSQMSAQLTSSYTPVSYTFDKIPFNKVYVDNHGEFSTSSSRFNVKKDGTYLVDFSLRCMNVPQGWNIAASVYRNGSEYARPYQSTGTGNTEHAHGIVICYNLSAGDYLDIRLYNSTASPALYVQAATTQTYFKVWRLG